MPKYIFENGVMKLDLAYKHQQGNFAINPQALAIVSSTQDIQYATQAQQMATGKPMQMANSTIAAMEMMQGQYFLDQFKTSEKLDGGDLLDGLYEMLSVMKYPLVSLIN